MPDPSPNRPQQAKPSVVLPALAPSADERLQLPEVQTGAAAAEDPARHPSVKTFSIPLAPSAGETPYRHPLNLLVASQGDGKLSHPEPGKHYDAPTEFHESVHHIHYWVKTQFGADPKFNNPVTENKMTFNQTQPVWIRGEATFIKAPQGISHAQLAAEIRRAGMVDPKQLPPEGLTFQQLKLEMDKPRYRFDATKVPAGVSFKVYFVQEINKTTGKNARLATYLFEEMAPTIYGGLMTLDLHQALGYPSKVDKDQVDASGDFISYALQLGSMIERNSRSYANPEDKQHAFAVIRALVEDAADVYKAALFDPKHAAAFQIHKNYLSTLASAPSHAAIRSFAEKTYGKDWLERIVGKEFDLDHIRKASGYSLDQVTRLSPADLQRHVDGAK